MKCRFTVGFQDSYVSKEFVSLPKFVLKSVLANLVAIDIRSVFTVIRTNNVAR